MAQDRKRMKLLVLGAGGMLGSALVRYFSSDEAVDVYGTVRSYGASGHFDALPSVTLLQGVDVENHDVLLEVFERVRPDVVLNAIGLVKQLKAADDPSRRPAHKQPASAPSCKALFAYRGAPRAHQHRLCLFRRKRGVS